MSQTHPSALDLAIARAAEKHLAAEKALASARARLNAAQSTFSTLHTYRGEYASRLRGVTVCSKDTLGNYHRFLAKLALALESQKNDVTHAEQLLAQQQSQWFASLRRLKAMELLRTRRSLAAQQHLRRLEQKQSDEFATRKAHRLREFA